MNTLINDKLNLISVEILQKGIFHLKIVPAGKKEGA